VRLAISNIGFSFLFIFPLAKKKTSESLVSNSCDYFDMWPMTKRKKRCFVYQGIFEILFSISMIQDDPSAKLGTSS